MASYYFVRGAKANVLQLSQLVLWFVAFLFLLNRWHFCYFLCRILFNLTSFSMTGNGLALDLLADLVGQISQTARKFD
jgi:hypothetical protein